MYPFKYSSLAQSVDDREKQLSVVFRREIAKIRSFEAEQAQAHKTTIFSGVSMKCARTTEQGDKNGYKHPSYSSLAQSVERMTVNHDVAGSSPAGGAKKKSSIDANQYCFLSSPTGDLLVHLRGLEPRTH